MAFSLVALACMCTELVLRMSVHLLAWWLVLISLELFLVAMLLCSLMLPVLLAIWLVLLSTVLPIVVLMVLVLVLLLLLLVWRLPHFALNRLGRCTMI